MIYPKVTVITVVYNAVSLIETTIRSVLEQDYPNLEYIVIDGGSDDGTLTIIESYRDRISYSISEPDNGIYDAMNKGIAHTSGTWINFMNAGDSFVDRHILSQVFNEIASDTDIAAGGIHYIENDGSKVYKPARGLEYRFHGMFCYHQAMLTKTALMKEYLFNTVFKIAADYDFVLKCAHKNKQFQFFDYPIANHRFGGVSEHNMIKARIEDLFIQTQYYHPITAIFDAASYNALTSYERDNNRFRFAHSLNHFYRWLATLDTNKRYVLYGFGHVAHLICHQQQLHITGAVDQHYRHLASYAGIKAINPDAIQSLSFDAIIITALGRETQISALLQQHAIPEQAIITIDIGRD
jgi:glycosyltransferase involved in cell wall biosynthesis